MPQSPLVGMLLVCLQRYLGIKNVTQVSFGESCSKRNPAERVHASERENLQNMGNTVPIGGSYELVSRPRQNSSHCAAYGCWQTRTA